MSYWWQVWICERFSLPEQWSLLKRFRTKQGHCGACRRKSWLTETQTMSHIVESCPLTKLNGGLSRLHSADEDAVSWLTNYGKWHAYEKNSSWMKKWTSHTKYPSLPYPHISASLYSHKRNVYFLLISPTYICQFSLIPPCDSKISINLLAG